MGEILLVVIGILIALSINNWNEKRKESIQELKILKNLGDDIKYNVLSIKSTYSSDSLIASRNRFLLKILKDNKSEYTDSLQVHFGGITFKLQDKLKLIGKPIFPNHTQIVSINKYL